MCFPGHPCYLKRCPILEQDGCRLPASPGSCFCEFCAGGCVDLQRLPQGLVAQELLSPWA